MPEHGVHFPLPPRDPESHTGTEDDAGPGEGCKCISECIFLRKMVQVPTKTSRIIQNAELKTTKIMLSWSQRQNWSSAAPDCNSKLKYTFDKNTKIGQLLGPPQ